ncbi:MAG TPA: ATP-grasp domain-containing protein [Streptosporangiaceae bacterium]|nr:ATP-grasp domain-containing protein [Streptosporangiaceae bacterium]
MTARRRVLLLAPASSYRVADFVRAATRMGVDLTVASDGAQFLGGRPVIPVRAGDPARGAELIASRSGPMDAVVAADAPMLPLAAAVAAALGLPRNPADAVLSAADKARQRQRWAAANVAQPRFEVVPASASDPAIRQAAAAIGFPCVVKAVSLSASQGVLLADDADQAVRAAARIRLVLADAGQPPGEPLLVEGYLHGPELSIDGLLTDGDLTPLAIFDKPAMTDGPTFEETLLVTPSRLPGPVQAEAVRTAGRAARALGLQTGPVHAELRVTSTGTAMLELAARSIGGLCSRALRFPRGRSLEELILASALGQPVLARARQAPQPSGVFMLPVPRAGVLRAVEGRDDAEAVPGITGVTITIPPGRMVRPLPDGDQYLGFIFAEAATPGEVETALTTASQRLRAIIE